MLALLAHLYHFLIGQVVNDAYIHDALFLKQTITSSEGWGNQKPMGMIA
jgi:hypothetical protein